MNDIELLKEEKTEIQTRTTETMSSLLRDLTDMGVAVNPDVPYEAGIKVKVEHPVEDSVKLLSLFDSHWKDSAQPNTNSAFCGRINFTLRRIQCTVRSVYRITYRILSNHIM